MAEQSGRSSKVGLVPESEWTKVPFTPGTPGSIGVSGTNPLRYCTVEAGGGFPVSPEKDVAKNEVDGGFETRRITHTGNNYAGKDSQKIDPENLYYPARGMLGKEIQTILSAASGGNPAVVKHVLRPSLTVPSYTQVEHFGNGKSGRLTSGNYIDKLDLTFGAILMAAYTLLGFRQIPNTYKDANGMRTRYDVRGDRPFILPRPMGGDGTQTLQLPASPTYVDVQETQTGNGPLVFAGMTFGSEPGFETAFCTINGDAAPVKIERGSTCSIDRMLEHSQVGGSGLDPGAVCSNGVNTTGKMDLLFEDNSIVQAVLDNSSVGLNFKFEGGEIGATGFNYAVEVYIPRLKFLQGQVDRPIGMMKTGGNYEAEVDTTRADAYSPQGYSVQLTLINTLDATNITLGNVGTEGLGGAQFFVGV